MQKAGKLFFAPRIDTRQQQKHFQKSLRLLKFNILRFSSAICKKYPQRKLTLPARSGGGGDEGKQHKYEKPQKTQISVT